MIDILPAVFILGGGIGLGFALARARRALAVVFLLLAVVGFGVAVLIPTAQAWVVCRILSTISGGDEHPFELARTWVGWDTTHTNPYCRLELERYGTGRCVLWFGSFMGKATMSVQRVTSWSFSRGNRIDIWLESEKGQEHMRGEARDGMLLLEFAVINRDNPRLDEKWFGPIHLVPEETAETALRDVAGAMGNVAETR
ncbi:MAG TPA: hypothetical protein VFY93_17170 [Planctomycetota bacterium]|nr:hypothetical protein [Planctomycetota bacterium]